MTAEHVALLSTLLTFAAGGVGWLIKRQATKRDAAELEAKQKEQTDEARRIAETPELQQIVAEQVQDLIRSYAEQNRQLIKDNTEQRQRHAEDRRSWESDRRTEREEWQRQVTEWERAKRDWDAERTRFREIIDDLRSELAPYRKPKAHGEVNG